MSNPRGKDWQCTKCHLLNTAVSCKLTNVPALRCRRQGCNNPSSTCYASRITEAIILGRDGRRIPIDVPIYQQIGGTCGIYAATVVVRLMWMLHHGWTTGSYHSVEPDVVRFVKEYRKLYESAYPVGPDGKPIEGVYIGKVLQLMLDGGIPLQGGIRRPLANPEPTIKIKSFESVPLDVEELTRLIADGYPLIALVPMGCLQHLITCEQVYNAPEASPQAPLGQYHWVAMIGSGLGYKAVAGYEPVYETYFVVRDSAGHFAHHSLKKGKSDRGQGVGGDFQVWSSDLIEVWKVEIVDNYLPKKN